VIVYKFMKFIVRNYPRLTFLLLAIINVWLLVAIIGCNNITQSIVVNKLQLKDLSDFV